jgi:hypothetical protein
VGNLLTVHSACIALRRSASWDDLDPSLMHRVEPLSLLLRILIWDGADEVVAPAAVWARIATVQGFQTSPVAQGPQNGTGDLW